MNFRACNNNELGQSVMADKNPELSSFIFLSGYDKTYSSHTRAHVLKQHMRRRKENSLVPRGHREDRTYQSCRIDGNIMRSPKPLRGCSANEDHKPQLAVRAIHYARLTYAECLREINTCWKRIPAAPPQPLHAHHQLFHWWTTIRGPATF